MQLHTHRFFLKVCMRLIPEHRSPRGVESFIREEAVSCGHSWSVESHQTIKLFQRHAHGPLGRKPQRHQLITAGDVYEKKSLVPNLYQNT